MESRIPEFQPKAKGDLSAFDEREEDWEKYKEQGGQKDHDQFCSDQMVAGFEAYLRQELRISSEASERDFAEAQWYLLLKDALKASMIHLKRGEDFKVGTRNQKDLEGQSYANMIASAVEMMKAQGDLKLKEMPDPEFLTTNMHKDWRPICDAETVQFLECENYVFADSVLKLGKKKGASGWVNRYEQALWWLPKESDLRLKTIHGQSFKYHWDVESGATAAGMLIKIKQLVDEKAGGDPSKFQDRVILFGCLNDLNDLPPLEEGDDPLYETREVAGETRDYIRRFRIGHFVWMGPGTEQVWQYDRRNPPIVWQPRADAFMKIIEDAGHPIFTGAVPLGKGQLREEGRDEHFVASWYNEKMLVRFIYDSNALASFLALWKRLPSKPKIPPKATSATSAGGDPVRKVTIKAGGDPVRSSSDVSAKAEKPRKRAAGDRSDFETSAVESADNKKRKSTEEGGPVRRKRVNQGAERINRKAIPKSLNYFLYTQLKNKLASGARINTDEAVEAISRLARFPCTIQPGDWFRTRPAGTEPHKPVPQCRELLVCERLEPELKVTSAKRSRETTSDDGEEVIVASLPHNHKIGPVYAVCVREYLRSWQMLVEVPSIANEARPEAQLTSWVIISHGITQWARWQRNTGDPLAGGFDPLAPDGGKRWARGDPGMEKINQDIPELDQTKENFRSWQKHCFSGRMLSFSDRSWQNLPAMNETKVSWISRTAALVLRHEDLHDEDGSVIFKLFYQRMTERLWNAIQKGCVQYVSSPQVLLHTIIRGSDKVRYQICWQEAQPKYPELLSEAYRNSDITPIYIRAVQGHSGTKELDTQKMSTWEVNEKHTYILYHAGHRHNIDSILRNGLLAGGVTDKPSRRKHCYFSIRDPRRAARGDPSVKKAWGDPSGRREEQEDAADVASGITTRPYPIHDKNLDALYQIDLKRARELGLHFYQTPSYAVLCDENIPPECILKITDMRDQVLYRNELLLACAPGDRPAYVQIGTALQNTKFHFDIDASSLDRSTIDVELIPDKTERDALFMKQYCCKFHNERICVKCHTFNMKGLVHCVSCGAAEQREPSKAKGTYVSVQDQIEFTNAELRTLVYKQNYKCRGKSQTQMPY